MLGFQLEYLGTNTTPVWPPSGIAFAALILCGYRVWPGIFIGALAANVTGFTLGPNLGLSTALAASFPIAIGNTLEGVVGLFLLRRTVKHGHPFERSQNVFGYLVVIPPMCLIAALVGVTTLSMEGIAAWSSAPLIGFTWWLGDAAGILVVTSFILVVARPLETRFGARWSTEGVALAAIMLVASAMIFGVPVTTPISGFPATFLLLPLFAWAALRFEHLGAMLTIMIASAFSIGAAVSGAGPFFREDQNESLLLVQGFVTMVAVTMLILATEVHQRRQATEAIRASQEALLESRKMEAVGRLAGGIAHDFNNLLQVVLGYVSLMESKDPAIRGIEDAVDCGAGLVRQLLAYSRQQVLDPSDVDLNQLIRETTELLRPTIGEAYRLDVRTTETPLPIHADRNNIERVLLNLALNARDAMPKGGVITIEVAEVDVGAEDAKRWEIAAGRHAAMIVRDTGVGMDEETSAKIFDPFFTTKEAMARSGLGLATVYGIVRQSGGRIDVESREGKGSTFRVLLPRVERDPAVEERPTTAPVAMPVSGKILLAEDNEQVRTLMSAALSEHGYAVVEARDGLEAQSLYESIRSEVVAIVTDVLMPGMTGPDLVRHVRAQDPNARVLFLSGFSEDPGLAGPRTEYLQKPFTPQSLLAKLGELLKA